MKIHTDTLNRGDLRDAMHNARINDVTVYVGGEAGSYSRIHGYYVALRGTGSRHARSPNTDITGAGREHAATRDDWGWWIKQVFILDPNAIIGPYKSRDDFDRQTNGRYV